MISLSNTIEQVLAPGQSITFDLVLLHTGCAERHRTESANVELVSGCIFNVDFSANIANGTGAGEIELSVTLNGEPLPQGNLVSTPAAANEINNVARPGIKIQTCGCSNTISVRNTGENDIILPAKSALLAVNRVA